MIAYATMAMAATVTVNVAAVAQELVDTDSFGAWEATCRKDRITDQIRCSASVFLRDVESRKNIGIFYITIGRDGSLEYSIAGSRALFSKSNIDHILWRVDGLPAKQSEKCVISAVCDISPDAVDLQRLEAGERIVVRFMPGFDADGILDGLPDAVARMKAWSAAYSRPE